MPKPNVTEAFLDRVDAMLSTPLSTADDHQVRRCLLDYLGCAVGGSIEVEKIEAPLCMFGKGEAHILGTHLTSSKAGAAFANGLFSHALELDDGHRRAMQHLGAVVFSTLLPLVNESTKWDDFSKAAMCGYEVAISLGENLQPQHKLKGFHATGTCGTVGAAVAACVLLGCDRAQTKKAIATAATSAAGLLEVIGEGSTLKPYNVAHASLAALVASSMALTSCKGPADILGGRRGFLADFGGNPEEISFGKQPRIYGIYTKPYSSCRHCHSPIECVDRIMGKAEFLPSDVSRILVETYDLAVFGHDQQKVANASEAKMSTPFGIASTLCGRGAYMDAYCKKNVADAEITAIMQKVEVVSDAQLTALCPEKRGARVTVTLKNGTFLTELVEYPKGEPENKMTDADLEAKALSLIKSVGFEEERAQEIVKAVWTSYSIYELTAMCCKE